MTRYFGVHTLEGEWHSLLPRYVLMSERVEDKQILDIGCGTGIGSSLLLEMGAKSVNAIDHRPEVLELARVKHAKQGLNFNVMFWEELDFPEDAFDMVLCLDPTSPVTDPSLLLEVTRVLRAGGEYICAIERRNADGIESLLPRYGYGTKGEELSLGGTGERVPQIGNLDEFFPSIVSLVQRPRYSFVFDHALDDEQHVTRRNTGDTDESGLWVGDDPASKEGSAEQTDERAGRWIKVDERLCDRDGEPASVELLFCGDEHMPPPTLQEVQMPYRGLVDRLHQLFSDLQLRQHPDQSAAPVNSGTNDQFRERTETSEFRPIDDRDTAAPRGGTTNLEQEPMTLDRVSTSVREAEPAPNWQQIREQLNHMTHLYEQVRTEMQDLFFRTRQELTQRDRYIEQLVDTVHRWRHQSPEENPPTVPVEAPVDEPDDEIVADFEREPTSIFTRPPNFDEEIDEPLESSEESAVTDDGNSEELTSDADDDQNESDAPDSEDASDHIDSDDDSDEERSEDAENGSEVADPSGDDTDDDETSTTDDQDDQDDQEDEEPEEGESDASTTASASTD